MFAYPGEMLPDLLAALALAFPIVDGSPGIAGPCPGYYEDPCEDVARWSSLDVYNAAKIPSDGVLVLQGIHQGPWDEAALTKVEIEVTLDAEAIAGTLKLGPVKGVLAWRPDAPWTAGATYEYRVRATNTGGPDVSCASPLAERSGALVIDTEPGAPLRAPVLDAEVSVEITPDVSLESMACCEGEAPTVSYGNCGYAGLDWNPDVCAPISGTGLLKLSFTGVPAAEGPAAQQIVYTRKVDGKPDATLFDPVFTVNVWEPSCVELEARDLASGKLTTTGRQCFGDDIVDQFGPQILAPPEALTCPLQRCEPTDVSWDLERCMLYEPQPDEPQPDEPAKTGCDCDLKSAGGPDLLGFLGLVGLARRRRAGGRGPVHRRGGWRWRGTG